MRRWRGWLVAGCVLVALLLVAGLMGGYAATEPEGPRALQPGQVIDARPLEVTLGEARAAYDAAGRTAEKKQVFVVVEATLTSAFHESITSTTVGDAFTVDLADAFSSFGDASDDPDPTILVADDGTSLLGLGPGLTYDVLLVYPVLETSVPDQVELTVNDHTRRRSAIDDTLGWFDAAPVGSVTLDVAPLTGERPKETF